MRGGMPQALLLLLAPLLLLIVRVLRLPRGARLLLLLCIGVAAIFLELVVRAGQVGEVAVLMDLRSHKRRRNDNRFS